ncbi:MAG: thioredoxin family protein [Halobacteria archaeon]|nr:thioredoxin family protein [Halobacteria archaeon]
MSTNTDTDDGEDGDRAEERVDVLIDEGVLRVGDGGTVTTTSEYEKTRSVYYNTYSEVSDDEFERSVADVFGISRDEAAERIEEIGVTRDDFITYMAVKSEVSRDLPQTELTVMADVVGEVSPVSAVPEYIDEIDDETYADFLDENPDSVVTVWKFDCAPCDEMKEEFADVDVDVVGETDVRFAGVNGEEVADFRREYGVDVAPAFLFFSDSELVEKTEGYTSPDEVEEIIESVY